MATPTSKGACKPIPFQPLPLLCTNMIPLLPYWRFIIHTSISHEVALERLSSAVAPMEQRPTFWLDTRPEDFTGTVWKNEFYIERIILYRNSFLPAIYGRFLPTETSVQVRVVMMLSPLILMIGIGLSLSALPVLAFIVYESIALGHFDASFKTALAIIAFLYLLFTGGFAYEAVIARRLLNRILLPPEQAEEDKQLNDF